jgi:potassium-dependent mechanosensitive channel
VNWSYAGDCKVRFSLPILIGYEHDPEVVMKLLVRLASENPRILASPEPVALITGFADSGISLELRGWIEDLEQGVGCVRSDLYKRVWTEFRAAGIGIPYPQREIRTRGPQ